MTLNKPSMKRLHPDYFGQYDDRIEKGDVNAARQIMTECIEYCKQLYRETMPENLTTILQEVGDENF